MSVKRGALDGRDVKGDELAVDGDQDGLRFAVDVGLVGLERRAAAGTQVGW